MLKIISLKCFYVKLNGHEFAIFVAFITKCQDFVLMIILVFLGHRLHPRSFEAIVQDGLGNYTEKHIRVGSG